MEKPSLRIASLNILNNPSGFGKRVNRAIKEILDFQPDVINLQEVASSEEDLMISAFERIGYTNSYSASKNRHANGFYYGVVTLAKNDLEVLEVDELPLAIPKSAKTPIAAGILRVEKDGLTATVMNAHLVAGSNMEPVRLRQAEMLAEYAGKEWEQTNRPIILAGDLNCSPQSSTVRFLTGLQEGTHNNGTLWVDAWDLHGNAGNEITFDPSTYWGTQTSLRNGFDPKFLPKRRIDYVMSFGWGYGKVGGVMNFQRWADTADLNGMTASDHFGVWSDIRL